MSEIPIIGANAIPNINNLGGPSIIPTINPPVVQQTPQALIRSLEVPVFRFTDPSIKYPTLRVPTQEEFDEAVGNSDQTYWRRQVTKVLCCSCEPTSKWRPSLFLS